MHKLLLAVVLGACVLAPAQARHHHRPSAVALVKSWYRQYLHREAEPAGLQGWVSVVRQGHDPRYLLSVFLADREYFQNAGGTAEGWIESLFNDLAGREPTDREYRYWMGRLENQTYQEVAYALLGKFGRP
jgi:hypothetical protein